MDLIILKAKSATTITKIIKVKPYFDVRLSIIWKYGKGELKSGRLPEKRFVSHDMFIPDMFMLFRSGIAGRNNIIEPNLNLNRSIISSEKLAGSIISASEMKRDIIVFSAPIVIGANIR
jgi:hypothetical protein